jgi:hypothetical protein
MPPVKKRRRVVCVLPEAMLLSATCRGACSPFWYSIFESEYKYEASKKEQTQAIQVDWMQKGYSKMFPFLYDSRGEGFEMMR